MSATESDKLAVRWKGLNDDLAFMVARQITPLHPRARNDLFAIHWALRVVLDEDVLEGQEGASWASMLRKRLFSIEPRDLAFLYATVYLAYYAHARLSLQSRSGAALDTEAWKRQMRGATVLYAIDEVWAERWIQFKLNNQETEQFEREFGRTACEMLSAAVDSSRASHAEHLLDRDFTENSSTSSSESNSKDSFDQLKCDLDWSSLNYRITIGISEIGNKPEWTDGTLLNRTIEHLRGKSVPSLRREVQVKSTGCYVVTATYGSNSREARLVHARCRRTFVLNPFMTIGWCLYKYYGPILARWSQSSQIAFRLCRALLADPIIQATRGNRVASVLWLVYLAILSLVALVLLLPTVLLRMTAPQVAVVYRGKLRRANLTRRGVEGTRAVADATLLPKEMLHE